MIPREAPCFANCEYCTVCIPMSDTPIYVQLKREYSAVEESRSQDEEIRRIQEDLAMHGFGVDFDTLRKLMGAVESMMEAEKRISHRHHSMIDDRRKNLNPRIRKPQTRALGRAQSHRSRR